MKVLSLTQPWASLVALGEKKFETRSWKTPYIGPLAIHASLGYPRWAKLLCEEEPFLSSLRANGEYLPSACLGVILCETSVLYCVPTETVRNKLTEKELTFGDYSDGRWAWALGPITMRYGMAEYPVKGHLGLWNWKGPK